MVVSAGTRLGPYEILAPLGAGGMGEVYRARDVRLHREVALKVLPEAVASDASHLARFEREARSASALNHPNIVTIYDVGREGAVSYIAMELVEGRSLRELLADGPAPLRKVAALGAQIAEGLARAHAANLAHRDLKPENVMVTPDGLVKILDFGLAKLAPSSDDASGSVVRTLSAATEPGFIVGTVGYMSPEQASGRAIDFRSDQFALGAILYELLTGLRAFQRASPIETLSAVLKEDPPLLSAVRPQTPEAMRRVIERCLAKEPDERYASTRDLARDLAEQRDRPEPEGPPLPSPASEALPRPRRVLVPVALVAVGVLAAAYFVVRGPRGPADEPERSIAILPFQNLGGRSEDQYFADGMTESLITDVARNKELLVIARNSAFAYKDKPVDPRVVGRNLGVRYLLEGSVQRVGSSVRVNVQLVDSVTGYNVWAEKYDRPLSDVFALQDDISRRIAGSLKLALAPSRPPTRNADAYDAYLRGIHHLHGIDRSAADAAIPMFERAISLDPAFAAAHAGLGSAYATKFFAVEPRPEWETRASSAIQRALTLDPNLPEAYVARGNLRWTLANGFPHEEAIRDFRRALEINPSLADARRYLGRVYYHIGLFDESLSELNQALRVDPNDLWVIYRIGNLYLYRQEYEKAMAQYRSVPKKEFVGEMLLALAYLGRTDEALRLADEKLKANPSDYDSLSVYAILRAREGDAAGADRLIARAIASGQGLGHFHHNEYWIGCAYAQMGRAKEAVKWVRRAAENGFPCYPLFEKDPYLDPLREDPEFQALLLRMKKQWEKWRASL